MRGIGDGVRIPAAFFTILSNKELRWLNLKCFVLNGLLFLGTVIIYNAITGMLFYREGDPAGEKADENIASQDDSSTILENAWSLT